MAAQVASQSSDGSQNRDSAGVSYASAVLNFKNMDSNKENINATVTPVSPTSRDHVAKEAPTKLKNNNSSQQKGSRQNSYASASKSGGNNGEDFPQIHVVSNRSVRRAGKHDREHSKPVQSGSVSVASVESGSKGSDDNIKPSPSGDSEEINTESEPAEDVPEQKIFVEAPLPKINPWTVNKNAASVITGKPAVEKPQLPVASAPIVAEKRVLQPQQQGTVGKILGTNAFYVLI